MPAPLRLHVDDRYADDTVDDDRRVVSDGNTRYRTIVQLRNGEHTHVRRRAELQRPHRLPGR